MFILFFVIKYSVKQENNYYLLQFPPSIYRLATFFCYLNQLIPTTIFLLLSAPF